MEEKVDAGKKKAKRGARPEIDRLELRALLLGSVPADCISWGKRLKRVAGEEGELKLVFEGKMTGVVLGLKRVIFLADELDRDTYYLFVGAAMVY